MRDSVDAGAKLLFAYETDTDQEHADALISWLETGQLPQAPISESDFDFITACKLERKHLPLLRLLMRSPDIFEVDSDGTRGAMLSVNSHIGRIGELFGMHGSMHMDAHMLLLLD